MPLIRLVVAVAILLLGPTVACSDTWSGFGSDWLSTTSWTLQSNGPPNSTEDAFFPDSSSGLPLANTDVQLSANTTILTLVANSPVTKQYTFTGSNGAVLTATVEIEFKNSDLQVLNVHTVSNLRLNTPRVEVFDNAVLSLNNATVTTNVIGTVNDSRIDVNNGSSVQTLSYFFNQAAGELRVNSGGELRIAGDTTLQHGTTTINAGGQLNALPGVDLEYKGTALLQFADSHTVDDGVTLRATDGGDITAGEYIDVGNDVVGSLTVSGAGSTLTAQNSISDWGAGSSGNATVTIASSGVATASQLRAGTGNAVFQGNVTSGATLRTTSTFRMGGGSTVRTVALTVDGGTLDTDGLATFDDRAVLNLVSGTVSFDGGATFNAGSRVDWSGGSMTLGANATLLVDGGVFNKTSAVGFTFSDNTTTRIRNGGSLATPSFFDLGAATLDMTGGTLSVGTTGGTISDWGGNGATTTATLAANAVATYHSGLRMGVLGSGGTTNATISGGARLVANGSFSTGGTSASIVMLNVTGGRVESDGTIVLERGTTTAISSAGVIEGQNITLGSSGGTTITTVAGANSLLKARGALVAGREGTSALAISAGGEAESLGATIIGELAGASASVAVFGAGSKLDVGTSLTIGAGGAGSLDIQSGGFAAVSGGVTVGSQGVLDMATGGSLETSIGQSIASNGLIRASSGSQIRSDIVNAGTLRLLDASVTRSVTLQANSEMTADNSTVGSLTQQPTADLKLTLRGVSDFDNLAVTGAASLGGDILVTLANGFLPAMGASFPIFTASSISGVPTFDFSAATLPSGLTWAVAIGPTSLGLQVISFGLQGDFDHDSDVDGNDFLVWQRGGSTIANSPDDLASWKSNYGGSLTATAATRAVPEPQAWLLGALACCASLRGRRLGAVGYE
jgi:T5SS/PEP-CTERM-associated repeat protein